MTHSSWGPGWPNCQSNKINRDFYVDTVWGRVTFPGGVRYEVCELVSRLVKETSNRGYRFGRPGNPSYGCWGFACRSIRDSDEPSVHSWGLSVDINAPENPMGRTLITNMPSWMPNLWNAYGFRWGGSYVTRPDAMHYEFMGSVDDAIKYTELARKNRLGEIKITPTDPVSKPERKRVRKMYALIKGDKSSEWWLTDYMTKRHLKTRDEVNAHIWRISAAGGTITTAVNNQPNVWPQAEVDNIPVAG